MANAQENAIKLAEVDGNLKVVKETVDHVKDELNDQKEANKLQIEEQKLKNDAFSTKIAENENNLNLLAQTVKDMVITRNTHNGRLWKLIFIVISSMIIPAMIYFCTVTYKSINEKKENTAEKQRIEKVEQKLDRLIKIGEKKIIKPNP